MNAIWYVEWSNPYTEPPDGMPRRLAEWKVIDWRHAQDRAAPDDLSALALAVPGYALCWSMIDRPKRRRWSKERKARERKRRLRKRMEDKYPMFAEEFIEQELEERPAYFAAEHPVYDAEGFETVDEMRAAFEKHGRR